MAMRDWSGKRLPSTATVDQFSCTPRVSAVAMPTTAIMHLTGATRRHEGRQHGDACAREGSSAPLANVRGGAGAPARAGGTSAGGGVLAARDAALAMRATYQRPCMSSASTYHARRSGSEPRP